MSSNHPILDDLRNLLADMADHFISFLHSNTFLNCILFAGAAFLSNLTPEWLQAHPGWRTWLPPSLAAFTAISVKINQQIAEKKQNG